MAQRNKTSVYCGAIRAWIELDGWVSEDQMIVVTHKSLCNYMQETFPSVMVKRQVLCPEAGHAVVICSIKGEIGGISKYVQEMGETLIEYLKGNFRQYPAVTAWNMAYDRAVIRFLGMPDNVYSSLEFHSVSDRNYPQDSFQENLKATDMGDEESYANASDALPYPIPGMEEELPPIPEDIPENPVFDDAQGAQKNQTNTQPTQNLQNGQPPVQAKNKTDVADYILDFGIYAGRGITVREAFEEAKLTESAQANLEIYLSKTDIASVGDRNERIGLIALQRYNQQIAGNGGR